MCEPAYDADGRLRPGAWVDEVTGLFDLVSWPAGMRVIVRRERSHPGAQLQITDMDGHRITAFVTNTIRGSWPTWSCATAGGHAARTGSAAPWTPAWPTCPARLRQNQIWCAIVALVSDLTAWTQTLASTRHEARRWEPKRLFSIPARAARTGRRRLLHLAATSPFTDLVLAGLEALARLTATPRVASG